MLLPVILSGGSGSRLWPVSRQLHPKQFICFDGSGRSMLQQTVLRMDQLENTRPPLVICNSEHRFLVADQLRELERPAGAILLEPVGRNTAPAAAMAALWAAEHEPDAVLLILPSDHHMEAGPAFQAAIAHAHELAAQGSLVTFGVVPRSPETGYGYIQRGKALTDGQSWQVARFVEKPDVARAEAFCASGEYFWNSGMFLFRADRFLTELEKYQPQMLAAVRSAYAGIAVDLDFQRIPEEAFQACPSDSIDYAVMEQTDAAVVVAFPDSWSDAGSWKAVHELAQQDASGNSLRGDVLARDTRNCYLQSDDRLLAVIGLENLAVVETPDALLIAPLARAQEVKDLVSDLQQQKREEASLHRKVHRPWGWYDSIDDGERFKVKHLMVKPGATLSLQKHHHRAEHWVVVRGTAEVTRGEETFLLAENESTYIPIGELHRLRNPGKVDMEIIEVQSGSYLGEDDIVRLQDTYGRIKS